MKSLFLTVMFLLTNAVLFAQETNSTQQKDSTSTTKPAVEKVNSLNEINVYGSKRQYLKIESDKTTVDVKNNAMLNSGSSFDAVKKLPGVITSPTGSLTLNGKGVKIYIDGAPSSLSGTDLQNYLSSLPASAIEKVELIYNPGASFDANSSGSVINIVTSSKRLKGVNASFNINYNFNKYQKPSPQILMNGKEKKLSWQMMLGDNYIDGEQRSRNRQTFTSFPTYENLDQKRFAVTTNRNLYFRTGLNYKLSPKSNLLFNYNLNIANDRDVFEASTVGTGTLASAVNYRNEGVTKTKNNNHEISLQYKTKLDTIGRTLDITAFSNFFDKNPISHSTGVDLNQTTANYSNVDLKLANSYLKYDFAFPFEKSQFSINTGGKFNTIHVQDNGKYSFRSQPIIPIPDGNFNTDSAIDFDYTENNLAFYVEARKKIKKFNFTAGLRYENFNVKRNASTVATEISYTNNNLFPNISALYEVTNDINVSASYSRKIAQPSYNVLDPNSSPPDLYNKSEGNPFLDPTFYDNYEFKISAFQFVQLGTNYTVAKDNNMFLLNAPYQQLVSTQTFQQFDKFKTLSAYLSFPIPIDYFTKGKDEFQKRMNNMDKMNYIFVNINYIKSLTEGYDFSFKSEPVWNFSAEAQFILPWNIKNSISYFILPSGTWEIYKIEKPIQEFDISFNRDFMNKNLKIGLHCFDVFNQNEINALVSSTNVQTQFYQKPDTRTFRVSLTYNFGNLKLEKENTDINVEKVNKGGGLMK